VAGLVVLSGVSGGVARPWHRASTTDDKREMVFRLLGEPEGHVLFYAWDRPAGAPHDGYPAHQLKVVYRAGYGAAHFTNNDPGGGPVGAWLAHTASPPTAVPAPTYDPWDPTRVSIPADALLTIDALGAVAIEYAETGQRPARVDWTPVGFV